MGGRSPIHCWHCDSSALNQNWELIGKKLLLLLLQFLLWTQQSTSPLNRCTTFSLFFDSGWLLLFYAIELCYLSNAHEEKLQTLIGRALRGGYNSGENGNQLIWFLRAAEGNQFVLLFFHPQQGETKLLKKRFFDAKNKYFLNKKEKKEKTTSSLLHGNGREIVLGNPVFLFYFSFWLSVFHPLFSSTLLLNEIRNGIGNGGGGGIKVYLKDTGQYASQSRFGDLGIDSHHGDWTRGFLPCGWENDETMMMAWNIRSSSDETSHRSILYITPSEKMADVNK